jgi:hypothetical protein
MNMERKYEFLVQSAAKNLARAVLEQIPMSSLAMVPLSVYEDYKDSEKQEQVQVERQKAQEEWKKAIDVLFDRLSYLEQDDESASKYLDFKFNRGMTQEECDKFSKLICDDSDIPLEYAEMARDRSGIDIEAPEILAAYDINNAVKVMNTLLEDVGPDLWVESINGDDPNAYEHDED